MSWFQTAATLSVDLLATHVATDSPVVDIGAGTSPLVDALLQRGYGDVTLLDIAENALAATRKRIAKAADARVSYVVTDVTWWKPLKKYAAWHDRAVFHFLTDPRDRVAYRNVLACAVAPAGQVVLATFGVDGPDRCSGLPVARYSADSLAAEFEGLLRLEEGRQEVHITPKGVEQVFQYARFIRL